jgi:hypothetical protein
VHSGFSYKTLFLSTFYPASCLSTAVDFSTALLVCHTPSLILHHILQHYIITLYYNTTSYHNRHRGACGCYRQRPLLLFHQGTVN